MSKKLAPPGKHDVAADPDLDITTMLADARADGCTIEINGKGKVYFKFPAAHSKWEAILNKHHGAIYHHETEKSRPARPLPAKEWPAPTTLPDPLPPVSPYSQKLLPSVIGNAVEDIAERMQCPPDFPAAAMLVAIAAVIGCRVGIRPRKYDDWLVIPNLWGAVVGRPSLKKTPAIQTAEKRLRALETRDQNRLAPEIKNAKLSQTIADAKIKAKKEALNRAAKKGNDAETQSIALELQSIGGIDEPVSRRIITTDPTIEKLGDMLNVYPDGMLLWVDELLGWMRSLDREDRAGVRQQFLTLWNGQGKLNIDRIGRGETVVESPCLSVFGCATPGGLQDYILAAVRGGRGDDGLIQRLQILVWPDAPKTFRHVDRMPDMQAQRQLKDAFITLADLDPALIGADDGGDGTGIPWLRFHAEAQEIFDQWDDSLQTRLRREDLPEAFESHLSKYASMVPSIALIIHLASGGTGPVSRVAIETAVLWTGYLESHASRVYSIATAPERRSAIPLLKRLIDWPTDKPIRVRTIRGHGWGGLSDNKSIERTLDLLIDHGWVRLVPVKQPVGRSTADYILHPEAKTLFQALGNGATKTSETGSRVGFDGFEWSPPGASKDKYGSTSLERGVI